MGIPQIADASRASPRWLRQSGRFAVISKSITGSRPCSTAGDFESAQADLARDAVSTSPGDGHELAQPVVDEPHSGNCSRNRKSFS